MTTRFWRRGWLLLLVTIALVAWAQALLAADRIKDIRMVWPWPWPLGLTNMVPRLTIEGNPGSTHVIWGTTNLQQCCCWTPLYTNWVTETNYWWDDASTSGLPIRFYKLSVCPY
ncbi:MAG TPA: hypothetical protein PKI20_02035 [Verrucomicrobiota bacterium]|jgi:hypothetical protein|nr:hypothetical protein [Verrucomicrobiota bacterium]HQL77030.1 hypothetical protein [Verrucomicrobiota bacterium]